MILLVGTIMDADKAPFMIDEMTRVNAPFSLVDWLDSNSDRISQEKSVDLFSDSGDTSYVGLF